MIVSSFNTYMRIYELYSIFSKNILPQLEKSKKLAFPALKLYFKILIKIFTSL